MAKGASFERKIAKQLSRWWSGGKRDDIFWRSTQSGGRATQRAKSGKRTFGMCGDIAAVDPIGQDLLKIFTIELKRGRSHGSPGDLLDAAPTKVVRPFEAALNQAMSSAELAGSVSWLLLCQRDRRIPMVYLERSVYRQLVELRATAMFSLYINIDKKKARWVRFVALPLDNFLAALTPGALCVALLPTCSK